jgi:uncharacterized protein (DUF1330 family)
MAKGYGVGLVNVSDPEVYKAYVHENVVALKRFGARFLVRGGTQRSRGPSISDCRNRVLRLPNRARLLSLAGIRKAKALRENVSLADIAIVEGYTGPQPNQS